MLAVSEASMEHVTSAHTIVACVRMCACAIPLFEANYLRNEDCMKARARDRVLRVQKSAGAQTIAQAHREGIQKNRYLTQYKSYGDANKSRAR